MRAVHAALGLAAAIALLLGAPPAWPLAPIGCAAILFAAEALQRRGPPGPGQFDLLCGDVYTFSVFLAFLALGWMPAWMFFVLFAAEISSTYAVIFAAQIDRTTLAIVDDMSKRLVFALSQAAVIVFSSNLSASYRVEGVVDVANLCAVAVSIMFFVDSARRVLRRIRIK